MSQKRSFKISGSGFYRSVGSAVKTALKGTTVLYVNCSTVYINSPISAPIIVKKMFLSLHSLTAAKYQ